MARARPAVDPVKSKILEEIGEELIEKLTSADLMFGVEGTPLANVKYGDGQFKRKPLIPEMMFAARYAYVATKGQLIVGMEPEDSQEWAFVEMDLKDLDIYFPFMGAEVAKQFGREGENLARVIDAIFQERHAEATRSKEEKDQELAEAYRNNANFGRF
ncbi:MAG: hypothetical protein DI537_14590 [Stutzerimonas stutzeri]|nr:MAG: hypothetical protein DI537_14590 [Stutzerimonas stutzeri]